MSIDPKTTSKLPYLDNNPKINYRSIAIKFSMWTGINGINHILVTNSPFLRIIWTILVGGAFAAAIYQCITLIQQYFSWPVSVTTEV